MPGLGRFLLLRLAFAAVLLVGVSAIVFFLVNALGNPIEMLLGGQPNASEDQIARIAAYYHLDQPPGLRYLLWLRNLAHLDLGTSITYNQSVAGMLRIWGYQTLKIQIPAILLAMLFAVLLAAAAARRQYSRTDAAIMTGALVGQSMPGFFTGILLILVFAYWLGIFPSYGAYSTRVPLWHSPMLDGLWHAVLPCAMLTTFNTATLTLLLRANMIEVLRHDYVMAARASGLPERRILFHHVLRNAAIPVLAYLGLVFGLMLATAPVTETVFTWPGLGFLYVNAIMQLDYPVIMGETVAIAAMLVFATLLADIATVLIDPRIRLR